MPDRYIERKGIIFNQIAERGDVDQTTKLQKENRVLIEKVERLKQEYDKLKKASEFKMERKVSYLGTQKSRRSGCRSICTLEVTNTR